MSTNEQIIQDQIEVFVTKDEAFTSVDIANAIKRSGTWIRNREVASWLRSNFSNYSSDDYEVTMIDVGRGFRANLYHPDWFDPSNYDGQNQKAMNPDDFKALHGISDSEDDDIIIPTVVLDDTEEEEDFTENSRTVRASVGRIWIPSTIIAQLGYAPGDIIPADFLGLSLKNKLRVHYDGRVAVQSSKVGTFADGDKVIVYIKDSKVVYEAE